MKFAFLMIGLLVSVHAKGAILSKPEALVHAKRLVESHPLNIACVTSEGLAFGVIYKSIGLPKPQVLVAIDDVNRFGEQTLTGDTFPGPFSIEIPDSYDRVPAQDRLGKKNGIDEMAKTTARIGIEREIQCVYVMTPGTLKAIKRPSRGGIHLE